MQSTGAHAIQHVRGTIGGNLCQDTRCLFFDQSPFWRSGRQPCHKAGGQICYAREGSDRCRSTHQSDGATALLALAARAVLASKEGEREIPLEDLYSAKGESPVAIGPRELLIEIRLPVPGAGAGSAYERLAFRSAIDYPIVSAAALLETLGEKIRKARVVVGAVSNAPLLLVAAAERLEGKGATDRDAFRKAAAVAQDHASAFTVDNVGGTMDYRIQMISVLVFRAISNAAARSEGKGERPA
jgi:CO/xanthine dehydrogenase FAD-binding subunit